MQGNYPSGPTASQLSKTKEITFETYLSEVGHQMHSPEMVTAKNYKTGDTIPAFWVEIIDSEPFLYEHIGGMTIPNKGDGGFCSGSNAIQLNKDLYGSSCFQTIIDLATQCQQKFSIDALIKDKYGKHWFVLQ